MGSHNGSIHTSHTSPPLSFYNTFNANKIIKITLFTWCPGGEGSTLPWMTATAACHLSKEGPPVYYPIRLQYVQYLQY